MNFLRSIWQSVSSLKNYDRSQLRVVPGIRNALGITLPLLAGIAAGHVLMGLSVSIGAQVAGFAGLNGSARKRLRTMLLASLWMSLTTWVGAVVAASPFQTPVIALCGFVAGLLVCVSTEAGLLGLWSTIALILISAFAHDSLTQAFVRALLVWIGVLLQAFLMVCGDWLLRLTRHPDAETRAIADVYLAISRYVREAVRPNDLRVATALLQADLHLTDTWLRRKTFNRLVALLDTAEWIRIDTITLLGNGGLREPPVASAPDREDAGSWREVLADVLEEMAGRIRSRARRLRPVDVSLARLQQVLRMPHSMTDMADVATHPAAAHLYADVERAARCLESPYVHGGSSGRSPIGASPQSSAPTADALDATTQPRFIGSPLLPLRRRARQIKSMWDIIRANLSFASSAFRHALRLAITLALASELGHWLPFPRSYWLPLTTLVILRPEFASTFFRGFGRILGTVVGALLATLLLLAPDQNHLFGTLLVGVFACGMFALLNFNYLLFTIVLTAEVVVLLSFFQHAPPAVTITDRLFYTLCGGLLSVAAYLVWPTWHHHNISTALADLVFAERRYFRSILGSHSQVSALTTAEYRKKTRVARTNAVNIVDLAQSEPATGDLNRDTVSGLLVTLHRFADILLALEYFLQRGLDPRARAQIATFGHTAQMTLTHIESAIRNREAHPGEIPLPHPLPPLPTPLSALLTRLQDTLATMSRMV